MELEPDSRYSRINDSAHLLELQPITLPDNKKIAIELLSDSSWTRKYIKERLDGRFEDYGKHAIYLQYETDWYRAKYIDPVNDTGDLLTFDAFFEVFDMVKMSQEKKTLRKLRKFIGLTSYVKPSQDKIVYTMHSNIHIVSAPRAMTQSINNQASACLWHPLDPLG